MYISELSATGFRCFGAGSPLTLPLRRGLNILVGANDSGKSAVIDIPRFVLWTRGDDYLRLERDDFHVASDGVRVAELLLRCSFDGLTADEESRFLEWCNNEAGVLRLHVCLRAILRKTSGGGDAIIPTYRSGRNADGPILDGDLREYLRTTYLRPLRDAERELRAGRRSRLSRILAALPEMDAQSRPAEAGNPPTLSDTMSVADSSIEAHPAIQSVQADVNLNYLDAMSFAGDPLRASLGLGVKGSFGHLLERLELNLDSPPGQPEHLKRGLGYNNLLFMAAELLLLQSQPEQLPLLLVEEPEAHLHPQHQSLFMRLLEQKSTEPDGEDGPQQVQILLSTHSPQLAASADLSSLVMISGRRALSLSIGMTKLNIGDYAFLRRFLDATKANLFFARGVLIVEGDAENLLIPAIAEKLDCSFGKHGVSIVNVGHRGLFRYSRIFQRSDDVAMGIPVALLPDRDIPPDCAKGLVGDRPTESEWNFADMEAHMRRLCVHAGGSVGCFPSEQWTLEYDLARHEQLAVLVHQAVSIARTMRDENRQELLDAARTEVEIWQAENDADADIIATRIFTPIYHKQVSKAQVAEQLAALISALPDQPNDFRMKLPEYLVHAIEHVTGMGNEES